MRHRGAENQNSDGEMETDICDTELQVQGHSHASKFSCAVRELEQEHGDQCLCAGRHESAVSMWTDGWIITKITHKLLAFLLAMVRAEREKALWRVARNNHGSLPRLDCTLTQPST